MLDLGRGSGQMLSRYGTRFRRAVGVDHSRDMLDLARKRVPEVTAGRCTLVESDFFAFLETAREKFSLATCVGRLHHVPADAVATFFRLARERLHDGGWLLLAEPVDIGGRTAPAPVTRWNARSVTVARAALMPMEESDEAPVRDEMLLRQPEGYGFRRVAASRGWSSSSAPCLRACSIRSRCATCTRATAAAATSSRHCGAQSERMSAPGRPKRELPRSAQRGG